MCLNVQEKPSFQDAAMPRRLFSLIVMSVALIPLAAQAQVTFVKTNPIERMTARTRALVEGLKEAELRQFAVIREQFGVIRSVRIVHGDVANAFEACGKNNREMASSLKGRFEKWDGAVSPVLSNAEKKLDEMINTQSFAQPQTVRDYLKLVDESAEYVETRLPPKVPVSSRAACKELERNVDATQNKLIELLGQILTPGAMPDPLANNKKP
jgi:hypothetical protein